jgi:hypothetical protein
MNIFGHQPAVVGAWPVQPRRWRVVRPGGFWLNGPVEGLMV